jgi:hypothetical protein
MNRLIKMIKSARQSEKGIALMFTLGVLGLLMVLALAFAATSIVERKAAANSNNRTFSRLLGQSALRRVVAGLDNDFSNSDIISHTASGEDNEGTFDWLHELETVTTDGYTIYKWKEGSYNPSTNTHPTWQYMCTDSEIVGRYAYVVTGGEKLCPSACVDSIITGINEKNADEPRVGVNVSEINLMSLGSFVTSGYADRLNRVGTGLGTLVTTTWLDFDTMLNAAHLDVTDNNARYLFRENMGINPPKDPEAFWVDTNTDKKRDASELWHRFNLKGDATYWDSTATEALLVAADQTYTTAVPGTKPGIKYLRNWSDAGGMGDATKCKNQICANIIDYCDSDLAVTTDVADWTSGTPTYTGLEETPYINDVAIEFEGSYSTIHQDPDGTPSSGDEYYDYTFHVEADVILEQINIYSAYANLSGATSVTIIGELGFNVTAGTTTTTIAAQSFTAHGNPITQKSLTAIANNTYQIDRIEVYNADTTITNIAESVGATAGVINNVTARITKVILYYNGTATSNQADFADLSGIAASAAQTLVPLGSTTGFLYWCYEVDDPRQNLNSSDWTLLAPGSNAATSASINVKNHSCSPNPGGNADIETGVTEPSGVSTAYIRNAPMLSPWELGLIHRGTKWQTLNLKKYNSDADYTYSKGDAAILDQIKMSDDTEVYGKVNLNTNNPNVLRALFQNIRVGTTPSSPSTGGTQIDSTMANSLASYVLSTSGEMLENRAELFNSERWTYTQKFSDGSCGITQDTDAKQEEIIGKFINLTKASKINEVTVIVLAQSIKDVGGPSSGSGIPLSKDLNGDGDISDSIGSGDKIYKLGYNKRDGTAIASSISSINETTTCKKKTYEPGFDEITGKQKIIAHLVYDSVNSKWTIKKLEYLDE